MNKKISSVLFIIILVLVVIGSQAILKVYSNKEIENNFVENSDVENDEEMNENIIKEVTFESFEEEVLKSEEIVLIDFYATWCGPCKILSPIVEEFAKENENVKVVKVDIDKEIELASAFSVYSIPTLVVIESGDVKNQSIGVISKENIKRMVFDEK